MVVFSHMLMAVAVARLRHAMMARRPPRWACRVLRVGPPGWLHLMGEAASPWIASMKQAISGHGDFDEVTGVYILFNHAGAYVGKANLVRKSGVGLWQRVKEHLTAIHYKESCEG